MKTHRERVIERLGLEDKRHNLSTLSKASGISKTILQEVYNRGIGAYKTNGASVRMLGSFKKGGTAPMSKRLPKEMWAMARCYSYIDSELFGAPVKHDFDLHRK